MCAGRGYILEHAMCLIAGFLLPVRHCVRTSTCLCQNCGIQTFLAAMSANLLIRGWSANMK